MTTLEIRVPEPADGDRTLWIDGAAAVGESVRVVVAGTGLAAAEANDAASPLRARLRLFDRFDAAMVPEPGATPEWEDAAASDGSAALAATLSLATEQLAAAFRRAPDASSLTGILLVERPGGADADADAEGGDEPAAGSGGTLYGKARVRVVNWPTHSAAPGDASAYRHDLYRLFPLRSEFDAHVAACDADVSALEGRVGTLETGLETERSQTRADVAAAKTEAMSAVGTERARALAAEKALPRSLSLSASAPVPAGTVRISWTDGNGAADHRDAAIPVATDAAPGLLSAADHSRLAALPDAASVAAEAERAAQAAVETERARALAAEGDIAEAVEGALASAALTVEPAATRGPLVTLSAVTVGGDPRANSVRLPIATATQSGVLRNTDYILLQDLQMHKEAVVAALPNKADLVGGKVPAEQLPSFVDDVLEFPSRESFPAEGESGKIYVATDAGTTWRWGGTAYVEISPSPDLSDCIRYVEDSDGNKTAVTVGTRSGAVGKGSLANGRTVRASGSYSHAEGASRATGDYSHSEGINTQATGDYSHSEGIGTQASGSYSHAEGTTTVASGSYSHAEGMLTKTTNAYEHSEGMFNATHKASSVTGDPGNTLHSIGFGLAENQRKNAVETMQDGKTFIYGIGGYDGTNPTGENVKDLATALNDTSAAALAAVTTETDPIFDAWRLAHTDPQGTVHKALEADVARQADRADFASVAGTTDFSARAGTAWGLQEQGSDNRRDASEIFAALDAAASLGLSVVNGELCISYEEN